MKIGIGGSLGVEEVEDRVRLGLGHAQDATREAGIHVDALPSGNRVDPNNGVDGFHWSPADRETEGPVTVGLSDRAVYRLQTL